MTSIIFGLIAALCWGSSDFIGGISSRRIGEYLTVFYAELIGMVILIAAIPVVHEAIPPFKHLLIAFVVGAIGSFALMLLYRAMSTRKMSVAAPIAALVSTIFPILIGVFTEGIPEIIQIIGFGFALAAVWFISKDDGVARFDIKRVTDLALPVMAGLGFGLYFVLIHQVSQQATFWPMIASRAGGTVLLTIVVLKQRIPLKVNKNALPMLAFCAIFDLVGNFSYILAGQSGRMDIAAVISSLYPGGTVMLAWLFLKERLNRSQSYGIIAALAAIVLMTL